MISILAQTLISVFLLLVAIQIVEALYAAFASIRRIRLDRCEPPDVAICAHYRNEEASIEGILKSNLPWVAANGSSVLVSCQTDVAHSIRNSLIDLVDRAQGRLLVETDVSSKSEQMNRLALRATAGNIYFLDADSKIHSREGEALEVASPLSSEFDVVQGTTLIREESGLLGSFLASERAISSLVSHNAAYQFSGLACFCGSNAVWRTDTARKFGFTNSSLTEDIEVSLRLHLGGRKIGFNPMQISTELAPSNILHLWNQRVRWEQGWIEAARSHWWTIVTSKMPFASKCAWTYGLIARRGLQSITLTSGLSLSIMLGSAGNAKALLCLLLLLGMQYVVAVVQSLSLCSVLQRTSDVPFRRRNLFTYIACYPFVELLKSIVVLKASLNVVLGQRIWLVTPRAGAAETYSKAMSQ